MSELKVQICKISNVLEHPNAERLEIIELDGMAWQCVVQKGEFKPGDKCIYFPIDSILPAEIEAKIFGPDSKVKLHKSRIRTIKLRKAISQGLAVPCELFGAEKKSVGTDLTSELGVTKYEPPTPGFQTPGSGRRSKKQENPHFRKYTDIQNFKNYPDLFNESEVVVITEKIHGTNFRCGWVPTIANTLWKKILKFFGRLPKYEFVYGSHNVQLQGKNKGGFYSFNVYKEAVDKYGLKDKLKNGEVLYGEIYGDGIQKGYTYGCEKGEHKLAVFDISLETTDGWTFLDPLTADEWCQRIDVPRVPVIYVGEFTFEKAKELTIGNSILCPTQKVREGIVIKPLEEDSSYAGRKILKLVSDEYLLNKNNTDFH